MLLDKPFLMYLMLGNTTIQFAQPLLEVAMTDINRFETTTEIYISSLCHSRDHI